jgi:O-glycosyl hydrolase
MTTRNSICRPFSLHGAFHVICAVGLLAATVMAWAQDGSDYRIRADEPQQIIKGLGFEIQSDSIGSLNQGMPSEVVAVPHDLTPSERKRLYKHMLKGFRYTRLALGLYLRGLDADQKHIVERYPGQMNDLATMQRDAGIEGFDVEYWSPAPYWKSNKSFYGGTIAHDDPAFLESFSDAMVQDVRYLQAHGLHVSMWGLQNEPVFGMDPLTDEQGKQTVTKMPYGICYYSPKDYAATLHFVAPKLRTLIPDVQIQANSWDGPAGDYAAEIRKDPGLLSNLDAWTWHQVGENSNTQIDLRDKYMRGAGGKPVYSNEFEYQPRDLKKIDPPFMNTGQSLMNWMVFENSPTWFWLHALKPVTNLEAAGYALGFWRPYGELKTNLRPDLKPGHWEFNPENYNALAGFLKYLAWDSTRLTVDESVLQHDQRILVWKTKQGRLGIALSNRGKNPYTFHVHGAGPHSLRGHRYTVTSLNASLGSRAGASLDITVPPQSFEFWIER